MALTFRFPVRQICNPKDINFNPPPPTLQLFPDISQHLQSQFWIIFCQILHSILCPKMCFFPRQKQNTLVTFDCHNFHLMGKRTNSPSKLINPTNGNSFESVPQKYSPDMKVFPKYSCGTGVEILLVLKFS